jgi:hypothetical protein
VCNGVTPFRIVCFLVLASAALLFSAGAKEGARRPQQIDLNAPILVVQGHGSRGTKSGLILAMWSDGEVLFSPELGSVSERLLSGKVPAADVSGFIESLRASGFLTLSRDSYIVPDAGYISISTDLDNVRTGHGWHGSLSPGFGGDFNTDDDYRKFVRAWKKANGLAAALVPESISPVDMTKPFRGYNPAKPLSTPWMLPSYWRPKK